LESMRRRDVIRIEPIDLLRDEAGVDEIARQEGEEADDEEDDRAQNPTLYSRPALMYD